MNDTAKTDIYTLSLHDALPIFAHQPPHRRRLLAHMERQPQLAQACIAGGEAFEPALVLERSEEHTSELQSQSNLVCRLLLEKKKIISNTLTTCKIHFM